MKKKLISIVPFALILMMMVATPVQAAGTTTPLKVKHTYTGSTLTFFDSDYNSKDYCIVSGNQLDLDKILEGLVFPKDDVLVDLTETSIKSDSAIDNEADFSPTFINNTYNTGVESAAAQSIVDSELSGAYADTRMDATVRWDTATAQTVTWTSYMATDENADGDYEDSADRHYRTSIGNSGQVLFWNAMADWNVSDADQFMKLTWSFKTTGANDYDFEIIHYTTTGDSAWSNIDSSGENKITLSLYDTDGVHIALFAKIDELLQMDLGDNPVISGLNELIVQVGTNDNDSQVDVRINNFAVLSDYPAITDGTDNDDDWDLDGTAGGLMDGVHDDNDFLCTQIVEGANEAYTETVALRNTIETSPYAMLQDAAIITFTGNPYVMPTEWDVDSDEVSGQSYFETTETFTFDSTQLDDFQTIANVFTWTDTYYNMTLTQAVLVNDYEYFEDDLLVFEMEGTDKVEELRALWDAADDDNYKVAYDGTNPDSTTGSSYEFELTYYSDSDLTDSGGVAVSTDDGSDATTLILFGVLAIIILSGAFIVIKSRQDKPKRKSKKKKRR